MFHGRLCYYRGRMPKVFAIASHPKHKEIITALMAGEKQNAIAARFGISKTAVSNFKHRVLQPMLTGANSRKPPSSSLPTQLTSQVLSNADLAVAEIRERSTLDRIEDKLARYDRMLDRAEGQDDLHVWAKIAGVDLSGLKLRAQLRGELVERHVHDHQVAVLMPGLGEQIRRRIDDTEGETVDVQAESEP